MYTGGRIQVSLTPECHCEREGNVALPPLREGTRLQKACARHPCRGCKQEEAIVETRYASPADQSTLPQIGTQRRDLQIRQVVKLAGCYS